LVGSAHSIVGQDCWRRIAVHLCFVITKEHIMYIFTYIHMSIFFVVYSERFFICANSLVHYVHYVHIMHIHTYTCPPFSTYVYSEIFFICANSLVQLLAAYSHRSRTCKQFICILKIQDSDSTIYKTLLSTYPCRYICITIHRGAWYLHAHESRC
jgi:hypothetical protein